MSAQPLVYFHADCMDGFGAAYAAWRRFGDAARYRAMHHGESWDAAEVTGRPVYILDFSFAPESLRQMAALAAGVWQIDHHASARDAWGEGLIRGTGQDAARSWLHCEQPALRVEFDMQHSGAALAWAHFHPGQPMPRLIAHIEDQDLWRFALPGTRALCRALRLREFDFRVWDEWMRASEGEGVENEVENQPRLLALRAEGEAIERFFEVEVERLAGGRGRRTVSLLDDHGQPVSGVAINASAVFASELGSVLAARGAPFALIWQVDGEGQVKASLRAAGQVDVAAMAGRLGGGGHPNAAGFRMPLARFAREVLGVDVEPCATPPARSPAPD